jgi:hypothetical protein
LQRLGPEGYSAQVSERVYSTLAEQAELVLRSVATSSVLAGAVDRVREAARDALNVTTGEAR